MMGTSSCNGGSCEDEVGGRKRTCDVAPQLEGRCSSSSSCCRSAGDDGDDDLEGVVHQCRKTEEEEEGATKGTAAPASSSSGDEAPPVLPSSRNGMHQWLLKRCMDVLFNRHTVEFFSAGPHRMSSLCYFDSRQYPGVENRVALTIDDAPGRLGPKNSRLDDVRELLAKYDAKATFFVVGDWVKEDGCGHEMALARLLRDGHELGNHGSRDDRHDLMDPSDFLEAVDGCSRKIRMIHELAAKYENAKNAENAARDDDSDGVVRYFRAPHGKYTREMENLLKKRNLRNVMCDAYASDPIVEDAEYLASSLLRQSRSGGIVLLHLPERGFRDYCFEALRLLLEGLKRRNMKVVTVGELEASAMTGNDNGVDDDREGAADGEGGGNNNGSTAPSTTTTACSDNDGDDS